MVRGARIELATSTVLMWLSDCEKLVLMVLRQVNPPLVIPLAARTSERSRGSQWVSISFLAVAAIAGAHGSRWRGGEGQRVHPRSALELEVVAGQRRGQRAFELGVGTSG